MAESEYGQKIPHSHTADHPRHRNEEPYNTRSHTTLRRQKSKAMSSFFITNLIAKLDKTLTAALLNNDQNTEAP